MWAQWAGRRRRLWAGRRSPGHHSIDLSTHTQAAACKAAHLLRPTCRRPGSLRGPARWAGRRAQPRASWAAAGACGGARVYLVTCHVLHVRMQPFTARAACHPLVAGLDGLQVHQALPLRAGQQAERDELGGEGLRGPRGGVAPLERRVCTYRMRRGIGGYGGYGGYTGRYRYR